MREEESTRVSPSYGRDRLIEAYTAGMLTDESPAVSPRFEALEAAAQEALDPQVFDYLAGSAGAERTSRTNAAAFEQYRLVPRMLRDVSERDLRVALGDRLYPAPVALAPIGVQGMIHERAEAATAEAAASLGLPFALSTVADTTIEELADTVGDAPLWFQLYWSSERALTESFVDRAAAAGYEAIVVTVDTPIIAWRERDVEAGYLPFLDGLGLANYFSDPVFEELVGADPESHPDAAIMRFLDVFGDASLIWEDLGWLVDRTDIPVYVKGILHPADAVLAIEAGADGVIVSNHGGRQVDNAIPAIEALPRVVDRLAEADASILFDSGIRRGADAVIALALGADMVQLGRPYAYALALAGAEGVQTVCENFLADLDLTVGLSGHASVDEIDRSTLSVAPRKNARSTEP